MSDERYEGASLTRRRVLSGLGVASLTSLAGCSTTLFGEDETNRPDSLDRIRLAKLPDNASTNSDRMAVPSTDIISTFGFRHLQQIRVTRPGDVFSGDFLSALFTTKHDVDFNDRETNTLWMSEAAMERINATPGWYVSLTPQAPHTELDTNTDARENSEYIEQSIDSGNDIIACAPHGGAIYEFTDEQAKRVASEMGESAWVGIGYNEGGGALDRWYIDQTLLHPASFPQLAELISYDGDEDEDMRHDYDNTYDYAVLFEGTEERGVYIGGLVRDEIKTKVRDAIQSELTDAGGETLPVRIIRTGYLSGTDTKNIANRLSDDGHNGIQIVQGKEVREDYWKPVTDAVISVFEEE